MSVYADTSFLLSYFGQDSNTPVAHAHASRWTQPPRMPWTLFGALEFNNAARALIFAGRLDLPRLRGMQLRVREDVRLAILAVMPLPAYRHYQEAELLSATHTARHGARTLDVLHVAAARIFRESDFLSFDLRQRQFAAQCGLHVLP